MAKKTASKKKRTAAQKRATANLVAMNKKKRAGKKTASKKKASAKKRTASVSTARRSASKVRGYPGGARRTNPSTRKGVIRLFRTKDGSDAPTFLAGYNKEGKPMLTNDPQDALMVDESAAGGLIKATIDFMKAGNDRNIEALDFAPLSVSITKTDISKVKRPN